MENKLRDGARKIARGLLLPGCHCLVTGDKEQTAECSKEEQYSSHQQTEHRRAATIINN